jgi:hypothetical protein
MDVDGETQNFSTANKKAEIIWSEKGILPPVLDIEPIRTECDQPIK